MRKLLISSAVAATLFATAGMAKIATDGTGQFLVAPAYFANNGFSTNLKLVNTDLTHSVIYRGVIREYEASQEIDFFVHLSPSDVWEAEIFTDGDGKVYLKSSDDSNFKNGLLNGVDLAAINVAANKTARSFEKGYVEFYPVAAYDHQSQAKVAKSDLEKAVDDLIGGKNKSTFAGKELTAEVVGNDLVAGFVTLKNDSMYAAMTIPMTAFEDVAKSTVTVGSQISYQNDTDASLYIDPALVYNDLNVRTATVPFEEGGKNDAMYFTFWADYTGQDKEGCTQRRSYIPLSRDMEENRNIGSTQIISPAPQSAPNNIPCELGTVFVSKILELTNSANFVNGMAQAREISNIAGSTAQGAVAGTTSAIVTYMRATKVNGQYSFSWLYAPVQ